MKSCLLALAASGLLALAAAGCGSSVATAVIRVSTSPWPEGPVGPVAATRPVPGIYVPLRQIEDAIPKTLPGNPLQRCNFGAVVEVTLRNGHTRRYGPCERPAAIERLRVALIGAAAREHPAVVASAEPVSGREWKSVINDWYTGTMIHWHRCAAVQEAIKHLPVDGT